MSPRRGRSRGLSRNLGGHRIGAVGGTGRERWESGRVAHALLCGRCCAACCLPVRLCLLPAACDDERMNDENEK